MHKLNNETTWQATQATGYNHKREPLGIVIIKAGYAIDTETGALTPLKATPAIEAADQHQGDPLKSALAIAGESSPPKAGGEFYIIGGTLPLPDRATTAAEAGVTLTLTNGRQFNKTIRAIGKRQWQGSWLMPGISKPEPLTPISLGYENAFGGTDPQGGPRPPHLANYAGKGYIAVAKNCTGIELPQLETAPYIAAPTDRPHPAGFGPIPVFWEPRRAEQGTPDLEAAKRGNCPYGKDAQASMHNTAPLDQRFPTPWQGGEILTLTNILAGLPYGKTCRITLPRIAPQLILTGKGQTKPLVSACDTFWIDAKKNQLYLIHRAAYPMRIVRDDEDEGSITVRDAQAAVQPAAQPDNAKQRETA